ncbi:MAG: Asp-tRNA(Asn)/Glu-tRNA(Gln) amidotransferase subunit GatA [bacterium]
MFWDEKKYWKTVLESREKIEEYAAGVRRIDRRIGAFLEFDPQRVLPTPAEGSPLSGIPIAVKDNIAVEGFRLTCGSKMLSDLPSPYTATAVQKLQQAGAWIVGKTNLDEFGMGSSTDNSALQRTHNPWDTSRVAGGSSGGSAAAVAAGLVPAALGSDTGGSIRQPASFCGIYGLKPTYGSVSRFGLVAYASSLEGIGVLSESLHLTRSIFTTMRGEDPYDQTTMIEQTSGKPVKTIGVLAHPQGLAPAVERAYRSSIEELTKLGYSIQEVELPTLDYVVPAYYTIASAEASANLARYAGVRYGHQNEMAEDPQELMESSRDEGFGPEVKLRILLGTYVLRSGFQEQYYIRAQKIRTALRRDFDAVFRSVDALLSPTFPVQAFPHDSSDLDQFQQKLADRFTATANLAGIPALAFPTGFENGLPAGMQLMAPMHAEERLFEVAENYQQVFQPVLADMSTPQGAVHE